MGDELMVRTVDGLWFIRFTGVDSIGKGDIARLRGLHNHISAVLYGTA
jgi:hypothetical protein